MILGNKCDLTDSRVVSKERGQLLADEHSIKFMETSAKASINVEEVSHALLVFSVTYACVCAFSFSVGFLSTGQRYQGKDGKA